MMSGHTTSAPKGKSFAMEYLLGVNPPRDPPAPLPPLGISLPQLYNSCLLPPPLLPPLHYSPLHYPLALPPPLFGLTHSLGVMRTNLREKERPISPGLSTGGNHSDASELPDLDKTGMVLLS